MLVKGPGRNKKRSPPTHRLRFVEGRESEIQKQPENPERHSCGYKDQGHFQPHAISANYQGA